MLKILGAAITEN